MMEQGDLNFFQAQFAFFFEDLEYEPQKWYQDLYDEFSFFDKQKEQTNDIPAQKEFNDIPLILLKSNEEKRYTVNISRSKLDLYKDGSITQKEFSSVKEELFKNCLTLHKFLQKKGKPYVRVGFVVKHFYRSENPDIKIKKIITTNTNELKEAVIRYIDEDRIQEWGINRVTHLEIVKASLEGVAHNEKGLLISKDVNTLPNEKYLFQEKDLKIFFDGAEEKLKDQELFNLIRE